jgi:hypothetical protein
MKKNKSLLDSVKLNPDMIHAIHVKEQLNKLFYNEPKRDEELEMLKYMWDNEEKIRMGLHASSITKTGNFCYKEQLIQILYKYFYDKGKKCPGSINEAFLNSVRKNNMNPLNLQRIYEQGTIMGYKWQMMFIRAGIGQKEDMDISRFVDEYDLSYTPDAIIKLEGKKYVVELKSQKSTLYDKEKSHPAGIRQLKLYMYFEGIERGFVLVDNKDTQDFKVLMVTGVNESDPDVANFLERLEKLQRMKKYALKHKKLPKCPCKKCS